MIYGVILNDAASLTNIGPLTEAPYKGVPKAPVLYLKPANTRVENAAVVTLPSGATHVEIGATVGVVFAREASRVAPAGVMDVIEGYVVVADLSLPHTSYYRPAIREKCFDGACPVGASVVPAKTLGELREITLRTYVDDKLVQSRSLADLVRDVPALVTEISDFMTFRRGDMLLVGVVWQAAQAGIGARVRVEAERLGALEFSLAATREAQQ